MIVSGRSVVEWVFERTGGCFEPYAEGIGMAKAGVLIAGVAYDRYNGASVCMHVAAEGKHWLSRSFLTACFDYPFNTLGVKKILGLVDSSNLKARRFDEHLGFQQEAVLKDAAPSGDLIVYSMTREQCRYLELYHGRKKQSASSA